MNEVEPGRLVEEFTTRASQLPGSKVSYESWWPVGTVT